MTTPTIQTHEGKKYLREIFSAEDGKTSVQVDIYSVIRAYDVTCPARTQAIKKLLCCGNRGKGDVIADLKGAMAALTQAIFWEETAKDRGSIRPKRLSTEDLRATPIHDYTTRDADEVVLKQFEEFHGILEIDNIHPEKIGTTQIPQNPLGMKWVVIELKDVDGSVTGYGVRLQHKLGTSYNGVDYLIKDYRNGGKLPYVAAKAEVDKKNKEYQL